MNIRMPIILCYQYLNFSKYLRKTYIYHAYFACNFNCVYPFIYIFIRRRTILFINGTRIIVNNNNNNNSNHNNNDNNNNNNNNNNNS